MSPQTSSFEAILERVGTLEEQNRRFKQAGAVVLALAASVVLMGQAPGSRTVEANEFILRDESGTVRARLFMANPGPQLELSDTNGQPRATLQSEGKTPGLSLFHPNLQEGAHLRLLCGQSSESCSPLLRLVGRDGSSEVHLSTDGGFAGSMLVFAQKPKAEEFDTYEEYERASPEPIVRLAGGGSLTNRTDLMLVGAGGAVAVEADEGGTRLDLLDVGGFRTTVGTTNLVTPRTGESHKTSAASVVLFDKDKKVIWQAP